MAKFVTFEDIDLYNEEQATEFVKWTNDTLMKENWLIQAQDAIQIDYNVEEFKLDFNYQDNGREAYGFMMKTDEQYIGYGQIIINPEVAFTKGKRVSWPSIAIGDDANRSKGFGILICKKIYDLSKSHKCDAIEVGIFEFNFRMKQILLENGFVLIGKNENKTFTQGKWWGSEHYLLNITE